MDQGSGLSEQEPLAVETMSDLQTEYVGPCGVCGHGSFIDKKRGVVFCGKCKKPISECTEKCGQKLPPMRGSTAAVETTHQANLD